MLRSCAFLLLLVLLTGCSSFGEGLMRGLIQKDDKEDTRQCYVRGPAFEGIEQMLGTISATQPTSDGDMKLLMVHGIGTHLPGYSTRLAENLARELRLDVVDRAPKIITLRLHVAPDVFKAEVAQGRMRGKPGDRNGIVTIHSYRSKDGTRGMTFYELTWSEITDADKRIIQYDDSGAYSFRRADLNNDLKQFVNSHLPDPLIYLGDAHGNIQTAVSQTLCWMFTQDYAQLPQQTDKECQFDRYPPDEVRKDSYAFISHSLGSRILTDAMQSVTSAMAQMEKQKGASKNIAGWLDALRDEKLTIFMLSNQLPLLQLGRGSPAVSNQFTDYCTLNGSMYKNRVFARSNIIAFSDPNDILSWSVPPGYEDQYMDSRMCPVLTNVIINIAEVKSVLGIELAAAGEAHKGYDNDQRVIKMIARGMSDTKADPMVKERCEWMEVR